MDVDYEMQSNWFSQVFNGSTASLLELPLSLGLQTGDVVEFIGVDSYGGFTGDYGTGVVGIIPAGEFFTLDPGEGYYYIKDLEMATWIDYSATSTIVGWSSFTNKQIWYKIQGDTLFWWVRLTGTSNSTTTTFTLPTAPNASVLTNFAMSRIMNVGSASNSPGCVRMVASSTTLTCFASLQSTNYGISNTKEVIAEGFYPI